MLEKSFYSLVRALGALLFIVSGVFKATSVPQTQAYMQEFGVPTLFLGPTIALEVVGGTLFLVGLWTRAVALALAAFCFLTAFIFHHSLADEMQALMFLKNVALGSNLLIAVIKGASGFSLDASRAEARSL